jgi:hypothetical protein
MTHPEQLLTKATDICAQINLLSALMEAQGKAQSKLILSFDVYCVLLEYTAYLNPALQSEADVRIAEEMIIVNDFVYETPKQKLAVRIDFFSPPGVVDIE